MSNEDELHLTELVPEFPNRPKREISRDSFIRLIINDFSPECQKQLIAGGPLTGKTNFLAQFALDNENRVISYFINANPLTQDLRTFLYVICNQIYQLLGKPNLPETIGLEELKNTFPALSINLANQAKKQNTRYYFAIDGLEWGAIGEKGNRIIDYPLMSFSKSPYILCSCRSDQIDSLPVDDFEIRDNASRFLEFNLSDTQDILSELNLSTEDIRVIHQKAKGLPGYIKIIKDTIKTTGTDWITSSDLPNDLENLIKKQLKLIYDNASDPTIQAIEIIAISPKPIGTSFLASMLTIDEKQLFETLGKTGIILYDREKRLVQISPEYTRDALLSKIGTKRTKLAGDILNYVKSTNEDDELLTSLLLREAKDYEGISSRLENNKIITTFEKSNGASLITKQMNIASQMAYEASNISEMIKWNLYLKTVKSAMHYAVDSKEISALIAIGDSEAALRKAYTLPDSISKVRLLARAYTKMKEKGERIPKSALEELKLMTESQGLDENDRDTLRELAIDLFPILPDKAVDILESNFAKDDKRSSFEIAATSTPNSSSKRTENRKLEITFPQLGYYKKLYTDWLNELSFENLANNINELENIKAKEYLIREWCTQNRDSPDLHLGIQLWLDTVVGDSSYSIPLRGLRKISSSLKSVQKEYQERLVYRLEIPTFFSIRTPWEEWIGFHLNMAEVLQEHNKKLSKQRIDDIHETINLEISDQDIIIVDKGI